MVLVTISGTRIEGVAEVYFDVKGGELSLGLLMADGSTNCVPPRCVFKVVDHREPDTRKEGE